MVDRPETAQGWVVKAGVARISCRNGDAHARIACGGFDDNERWRHCEGRVRARASDAGQRPAVVARREWRLARRRPPRRGRDSQRRRRDWRWERRPRQWQWTPLAPFQQSSTAAHDGCARNTAQRRDAITFSCRVAFPRSGAVCAVLYAAAELHACGGGAASALALFVAVRHVGGPVPLGAAHAVAAARLHCCSHTCRVQQPLVNG